MSSAGNAQQDVVGIFDSNYSPLFSGAFPMRALVNERSKAATHPLEDGDTFGDNVIDLPTEIELSCVLDRADFKDIYQQIKAAKAARNLVYVQTKTDVYANMLITEIPHDESPDMYDTVPVSIKLVEFILVEAQYAQIPASQVKTPANASTVKTGQQTAAPASAAQTSAAYSLIFGSGP